MYYNLLNKLSKTGKLEENQTNILIYKPNDQNKLNSQFDKINNYINEWELKLISFVLNNEIVLIYYFID